MDDSCLAYTVEPMTLLDVPAVVALEKKVFSMPWSAHAFEYELQFNPRAHFWVVRPRGQTQGASGGVHPNGPHRWQSAGRAARGPILGYAGLWLIVDEAHVCTLAVDTDWRRRGLGELLLVHLIEGATALDAAFLTLEVRVSNLAAQALYSKYGFVGAGLRKGYYSDNHEDALIMSTELITSAALQQRFERLKSLLQRRLATQPVDQLRI